MKIKHSILCLIIVVINSTLNAQKDASVILEKASIQTKAENKNVFILFHASWCNWCKKMDNNMMSIATKDFFEDNYVIEHLVVKESKNNKALENPGAETLLKKNTKEVALAFHFG